MRPGYKILQAYSLHEAKQIVKDNRDIDFVFLDLLLPDGDGDELIDEINLTKDVNTKIIILSGSHDIQKRNFLFEKGVVDYFIKETPIDTLMSDIHKLINSLNKNKQKHILIVDDSSFVRKTIENILKTKNFKMHAAKDPIEAFELLKKTKINLIFSDLEMPKMDGMEFLERIKDNSQFKNIPVIILSGKKTSEKYSRVLKHGAIDFIEKPFLTEEILLKTDIHIAQSDYIKQIAEQNMQLEQSISNLKETQSRLIESEKMASLGSLVVGMAHEINTPVGVGLTGITHILDISNVIKRKYINNDISDAEFEEFLDNSNELSKLTLESLNKIALLVKSFKQISVNQKFEDKVLFNFKKCIENILLSISFVTETTNLDIKITCEDDLMINSYPESFLLIFTNLITNSINAYKKAEQGNITIEVSKKDSKIKILYCDDAEGITKKNLPKIFEPFFTTTRSQGGKGLGLNIIYNIITSRLQGTIMCHSIEGKGTTFTITLPCE